MMARRHRTGPGEAAGGLGPGRDGGSSMSPEPAPVRFDPKRYDRWYERPLGRYCFALEADAIREALTGKGLERLLEVGAGTGRFAAALAEGGGRVIASDPDPEMVAWSARQGAAAGRATWVIAAGQALPFADEAFDAAFTVAALCFAPEHDRFVAELARVVRPGGRVVLGELNAAHPWQLWRRLKALRPGSPYRQARFHTPFGLEALLRRAGLTAVGHRTLLHWMPWERPVLLALARPVERWGRRFAPALGAFVVAWGERPAAARH
jgi:SAM-dependent methyltransferase